MAKLFLSYSRKDESKARRLAEWLQREGHTVWRDEDDIGGGASFSSEIEKALKDCDAVLVLWSPDSVQSAWVRDEAAYGRDNGKLIPLSLAGTEPPLGFRQFQAIDLSKWKGRGEPPAADHIRRAIERISGHSQTAPSPVTSHSSRRAMLPKAPLIGAVIAIGALALLTIYIWQYWRADRQITISVLPSPVSSDREMATDYANLAAADMAAFLPRRFDRATVIAPADASGQVSGYQMLISTQPHGSGADATLTLSDEDGRTTLWSQNWSVADASAADLKAEVSAAASTAALCLTDARGGSTRLSWPAIGLYLDGCAELGNTKRSNAAFVAIFERLTKLAPDFGPGWDYLALSRSWVAESLRDSSPAAYADALQSARQAIVIARKLNPDSAMTYDAEYHLVSDHTFEGLKLLNEGAKIDPDDGRIQMHLSDEFLAVGRMADSVEAAYRGIELAPEAPYSTSQYILALAYSGQFSRAKEEIAKAKKKWPSDPVINDTDFALQLHYGDPRIALELLPRISDSSDADMAPYQMLVAARTDPTAGKIDAAIKAAEASWSNNPGKRGDVLLVLADFGRVDDVYRMLEDPGIQASIDRAVLFRPDFSAVRADPRFMQIAARLGLVRYWRQTGYWPDFCTSERLHYDCKTEAAKYR